LESVDRIESIVEGMLGLAREKNGRREAEVDLNKIIEKSLDFFPLEKITILKELGEIPVIKGDPGEIQEVFVNLIQNAIEAMQGVGTLTFRSYLEGQRVAVEVSDTGKGIPKDLHEKIFDPFFSTRHEGVGLGLSIAYRIIREHGGDIKVISEEGKGTTFKLIF
ncbi:MAG: ATP-binding protein, partial [Candidatus Margulisbacteria bacterium]|nr:ATP-binding protein [Candidatus Margulisiibacteriota bacterium]